MALFFFGLLLVFLPVQLASSCSISGPSNPILFYPTRGEAVCSGVESAWCFHFKAVVDGTSIEEATGCAEWFLEVAQYIKYLAPAAEICDADPSGVYNLTNTAGTILVQCSPIKATTNPSSTEETTTTETEPPYTTDQGTPIMEQRSEMTTSDSERKTNVCPVEGQVSGLFVETEGKEICKDSTSDWCFQYEASYEFPFHRRYTVRGCSQWLGNVSVRHSSAEFLKDAYIHCSMNNSAVFQKKMWFSSKLTCSPAAVHKQHLLTEKQHRSLKNAKNYQVQLELLFAKLFLSLPSEHILHIIWLAISRPSAGPVDVTRPKLPNSGKFGIANFIRMLFLVKKRFLDLPETPPPPLIPRSAFYSTSDRSRVALRPDSRFVAFFAPYEGVQNIWVQPLDGASEPRLLTKDNSSSIAAFSWTYLPDMLFYLRDKDGDENYQLWSLNASSAETRPLTTAGARTQVLNSSPWKPNSLIIGINNRVPKYHDIFHLDLTSGRMELILENNRFRSFIFDKSLELRLAFEIGPSGERLYYTPVRNETGDVVDWTLYRNVSLVDSYQTKTMAFTPNNDQLYWRDTVGRNFAALVLKDFDKPESKGEILFMHNSSDFFSVLFHPQTKKPVAVQLREKYPETVVLDPDYEAHFDTISAFFRETGGFPSVRAYSEDFKIWIVYLEKDDGPGEYYAFDTMKQKLSFLYVTKKALLKYRLNPMRPVEIRSRDGLRQVCFLTIPVEQRLNDKGQPPRPLPMVLFVHGGPWVQDIWSFRPYTQLFANRGYAVLQCNYRISTGYGKAHFQAGFGEWGGKMQDDLVDAVKWATERGIADPDRVAIVGGSYGGYATLAGLAFTPELFACGVDIVGISNLVSFMESVPEYWLPSYNKFIQLIGGDPRTAKGRAFLKSRSPLTSAGDIRKPLLIGQGANDPRVKQAESDQIVQALKGHGIPVTYLLFPDEGHGFYKPDNKIAFSAVMDKFLQKCLGGRTEPILDELTTSSVKIVEDGGLSL